MVNVARCRKCGARMSQVWGMKEDCSECGGPVDQVRVDMGYVDRVPRIVNMLGIALAVFAVLYLLLMLAMDDLGSSEGTVVIILFIAGILCFAVSLMVQIQLASVARTKEFESGDTRRMRKLRPADMEDGSRVRSGRIQEPPRRTASKLPIRRR
ncbi:MAG: hypothetical protein ACMUHY_07350 [Thermoplasmatota archaeon]